MYHTPQSGKGDKPRPMNVSLDEYRDNWETIFGKKAQKPEKEQEDTVVDQPEG